MDSWEGALESLWKRQWQDGMDLMRNGLDLPSMEMSGSSMNKTLSIINHLGLHEVQVLRYVHIGAGSLSCFMALLVICRIWYDSWRAQQLSVRLHPRRWTFLYHLHPAESFPLILGFVIFFQALSFVIIQAFALRSLFLAMCKSSSQTVFTQIFIIGWFHMVFGLDMTIRALRPPVMSAAPRRIRSTVILVLCVLVLTLATWLSTRIRPPDNRCFGDVIFRSIKSSLLGIVLCAIMIPSFITMALIIGIRLYKTVLMDHNERIAGTRMVYYLVEAAILYIMIIPFWIQAMTGTFDSHLSSSRIAQFVLFSWGTVICFTHFFLRANAVRTAIKPNRTPWMKKRKFRLFGPSDLELINISPPILKAEYEPEVKEKSSPWANSRQKVGMLSSPATSSPGSNPSYPAKPGAAVSRPQWPLLDDMEMPKPKSPKIQVAQPSYSLFPGGDDIQLPSVVYAPEKKTNIDVPTLAGSTTAASALTVPSLLTPPMPFSEDSSRDSTATLQIGMRFSSAPAAAAAARPSTPPSRPSLRSVIDNMTEDPFIFNPLPLAAKSPQPEEPQHGRQRGIESLNQQCDYGWLDLQDSYKSPTRSERVPSVYLSRKESQRRLAETNRQDLANLERSGSGASRARLRPAYPNPATPDGSTSASPARHGFF